MIYHPLTIRFFQQHMVNIHGVNREFQAGEILHIADKQTYDEGEMTPYHAAICVMGKKCEVIRG